MTIDAAAFKKGMRHLAASVTLITTRHDGTRGGLTATAGCSVSADPPQILVCVNKSASALTERLVPMRLSCSQASSFSFGEELVDCRI